MARIGIIRQDQIRGSGGGDQRGHTYKDDLSVSSVTAVSSQNTLIDDLNMIRSILRTMHGGTAWWDATELSRGTFIQALQTPISNFVMAGPGSLLNLCPGTVACILTNHADYSDVYAGDLQDIYGRAAFADARKIEVAGVTNLPDIFYAVLGVVVASLGSSIYKICTGGYSGLTSIADVSGNLTVAVEPGETYYLGANGQIITRSTVLAAIDTYRVQRIGYGVYDASTATTVLNVDLAEAIET